MANLVNLVYDSLQPSQRSLCLQRKRLTNSLDNHEATVGVFIDLKKAFDTVDHSILIEKLYHYGIRGTANKWICSYLMNRYQSILL